MLQLPTIIEETLEVNQKCIANISWQASMNIASEMYFKYEPVKLEATIIFHLEVA